MKFRFTFFTLILLTALLFAACSSNAPAPAATEDMVTGVPSEVIEDGEPMQEVEEGIVEAVPVEPAEAPEVEVLAVETEMADEPMDEEMPEANAESEWMLISQGQFQGADASHRGSGTASIFQQNDQRVLRFEDFEVTDGPDLRVLLVENPAAADHEAIGGYIDLGKLKGSSGSQEYEVAPDVDLTKYQGVMIYCEPFQVVFASAPLGN